jgi:hypothetical protein
MDREFVLKSLPGIAIGAGLVAGMVALFTNAATGLDVAGIPVEGPFLSNVLIGAGFAVAAALEAALGNRRRAAVDAAVASCWVAFLAGLATDRSLLALGYTLAVVVALAAAAVRSPAWRRAFIDADLVERLSEGSDGPQ